MGSNRVRSIPIIPEASTITLAVASWMFLSFPLYLIPVTKSSVIIGSFTKELSINSAPKSIAFSRILIPNLNRSIMIPVPPSSMSSNFISRSGEYSQAPFTSWITSPYFFWGGSTLVIGWMRLKCSPLVASPQTFIPIFSFGCRSKSPTFNPLFAKVAAAIEPAVPAPAIITS